LFLFISITSSITSPDLINCSNLLLRECGLWFFCPPCFLVDFSLLLVITFLNPLILEGFEEFEQSFDIDLSRKYLTLSEIKKILI
jgi:hypothetical protein